MYLRICICIYTYVYLCICVCGNITETLLSLSVCLFTLLIFLSYIFEAIISLHFYLLFPVFKPIHVPFALHPNRVLFFTNFIPCLYEYNAHVCIYLHIPKYNLLNLYTIAHVYVFLVDHCILENPSVFCSLGKTISSTIRIP